tara:strand:+ start:417 stop:1061 length:645 start_codon:yes stop_codon:yes gene_type:complete
MKYVYFLIFLTLISCASSNKSYVCGDRLCIDKKEFKEYFAENLVYEIKTKTPKKQKSLDLVKLNSIKQDKNIKSDINTKQDNKLSKKERRAWIKSEKLRLKKERKNKVIQEKLADIEKKKLAKLKKIKNKKITNSEGTKLVEEKPILKMSKKSTTPEIASENTEIIFKDETFKNVELKSKQNSCSKIIDCDFDKITELLIKKGKEKDFPDINFK